MCYRIYTHNCICPCYVTMADPSHPRDVWMNPYASPTPCECPQRTDFPVYLRCSSHRCCILTGKTYECPFGDCPRPIAYHKYRRAGKYVDSETGRDEYDMLWDIDKVNNDNDDGTEEIAVLDETLVSFMEKLGQAPAFESHEFLLARESFCKISTRARWLYLRRRDVADNLGELERMFLEEMEYCRLLLTPLPGVTLRPSSSLSSLCSCEGPERESQVDSGVDRFEGGYRAVATKNKEYVPIPLMLDCPREVEASRRRLRELGAEITALRGQLAIMRNENRELKDLWTRWALVLKGIEYQGRGSVNWGSRKPWARLEQQQQQQQRFAS